MPHLFEPLTIRGITLRNRIGVPPMCMYSYQDGFSNDWQVVHLGSRAVGGAGLIIAEATAVEPRGRITPFDVGIWSDDHVEPLAQVTRVVKANGAVPGIQIAHAGRKASSGKTWEGGKPILPDQPLGWQGVAPSPIAYNQEYAVPHELSVSEIHTLTGCLSPGCPACPGCGFRMARNSCRPWLFDPFLLFSYFQPTHR